MRYPDPFRLTPAERWTDRFHRLELSFGSSRLGKPIATVGWIGFMTSLILSSPLIRKRDVAQALGRFWMWQFWRRTLRTPVLVHSSGADMFFVPPSSKLGSITVSVGMHEPREELFVADFVRSGDVVLDVGANIGIYTVIAANRGARVYAFEPSSEARAGLEENVALLGKAEVHVFPAALGAARGQVRLTVGLDVRNHLLQIGESGDSEMVDVLALDDLTMGHSPAIPGPIALAKIDAEGFDELVLKGAEETLLRDRPVLIVETWGDDKIRDWLDDRGYLVFLYVFETGELVEYPRPWTRQANFVAVHSDTLTEVRDRLSAAQRDGLSLPALVWRRRTQRDVLGRIGDRA